MAVGDFLRFVFLLWRIMDESRKPTGLSFYLSGNMNEILPFVQIEIFIFPTFPQCGRPDYVESDARLGDGQKHR